MPATHLGIEIVTHCYSGGAVNIYHHFLRYQLQSLLLGNHLTPMKVTVCMTLDDIDTYAIVSEAFKMPMPPNATLNIMPLSKCELFRRGYGRNVAAQRTTADVVWFTDVDHLFLGQSIDTAYAETMSAIEALGHKNIYMPREIMIHKKHAYGDEEIERSRAQPIGVIKPLIEDRYQSKSYRRAIGGVQIVSGDYCRAFGYSAEKKYISPTDADDFQQCRCDVSFRRSMEATVRLDIPGVYRMRHSRAGRDGGEVDHGAQTA